ncbi:hypothetical protein GQ457_01G025010 [Hibiscus cannabinus]
MYHFLRSIGAIGDSDTRKFYEYSNRIAVQNQQIAKLMLLLTLTSLGCMQLLRGMGSMGKRCAPRPRLHMLFQRCL